jgi:F-box protein 39
LHTLIIRELISTATILIIITTAQCLTRFLVRRNAIIKKFDWEKQTEWSDEFYNWLKNKSRSYEDTFEEVSKTLGKKWYPLTDEEFKRIAPDITF